MQTQSTNENYVCLSVCMSNASIVTKRKKYWSIFLYKTNEHKSCFLTIRMVCGGWPLSSWKFGSTGPRYAAITWKWHDIRGVFRSQAACKRLANTPFRIKCLASCLQYFQRWVLAMSKYIGELIHCAIRQKLQNVALFVFAKKCDSVVVYQFKLNGRCFT